MNKIFLIGNITKDQELSSTSNGISCANFSLAVKRSHTDSDGERQTDFFPCVAWRKTAEVIADYVRKGDKIAVTGELQIREYTDRDGIKRKVPQVVVSEFDFCGQKRAQENDYSEARTNTQGAQGTRNKPTLTPVDDDSDIPF